MEIKITKEAKEYFNKSHHDAIYINMKRQESSSGCCAGKTKKFYIASVELGYKKENSKYNNVEVDNITIYYSNRIIPKKDSVIEIYLEKFLMIQKLQVDGIDFLVE